MLEIEPTDVRGAEVLKTILNGGVVYDRTRDDEPHLMDESEHAETGRIMHRRA